MPGCPPEQIGTCEGCSNTECLEDLKARGLCLVCGKKDCGEHLISDLDDSIKTYPGHDPLNGLSL